MVVESMMVAIAPLVPHFLMGIAAGAGILGMVLRSGLVFCGSAVSLVALQFMIVTGFVQPTNQLPKPILLYPLHWFSFQTCACGGEPANERALAY